jgi:hypothetical protein
MIKKKRFSKVFTKLIFVAKVIFKIELSGRALAAINVGLEKEAVRV